MNEFTGTYYRCNSCATIYDYNDLCPDCGSDDIEDVNVNEVKAIMELKRLTAISLGKMLESHGDLVNTIEVSEKELSDFLDWAKEYTNNKLNYGSRYLANVYSKKKKPLTPKVTNKEISDYKRDHALIVEFMYWQTGSRGGSWIDKHADKFLKQRKCK